MNLTKVISLLTDNGVKVQNEYMICHSPSSSSAEVWNWKMLCMEGREFALWLPKMCPDFVKCLLKSELSLKWRSIHWQLSRGSACCHETHGREGIKKLLTLWISFYHYKEFLNNLKIRKEVFWRMVSVYSRLVPFFSGPWMTQTKTAWGWQGEALLTPWWLGSRETRKGPGQSDSLLRHAHSTYFLQPNLTS